MDIYADDIDYYSISINDLQRQYEERQRHQLEHFKKVLDRCFRKIKACSNMRKTYCFFKIECYQMGRVRFDVRECIEYLTIKLREKGFRAAPIDEKNLLAPYLYISWQLKRPNLKQLEKMPLCIDNVSWEDRAGAEAGDSTDVGGGEAAYDVSERSGGAAAPRDIYSDRSGVDIYSDGPGSSLPLELRYVPTVKRTVRRAKQSALIIPSFTDSGPGGPGGPSGGPLGPRDNKFVGRLM